MVTLNTDTTQVQLSDSHASKTTRGQVDQRQTSKLFRINYYIFSKLFNDSRRILRCGCFTPKIPSDCLTLSNGLPWESVLSSPQTQLHLQLKQPFQSCPHVHVDSCAYQKSIIKRIFRKAIQTLASSEKTVTAR